MMRLLLSLLLILIILFLSPSPGIAKFNMMGLSLGYPIPPPEASSGKSFYIRGRLGDMPSLYRLSKKRLGWTSYIGYEHITYSDYPYNVNIYEAGGEGIYRVLNMSDSIALLLVGEGGLFFGTYNRKVPFFMENSAYPIGMTLGARCEIAFEATWKFYVHLGIGLESIIPLVNVKGDIRKKELLIINCPISISFSSVY